MRRYSAKCDAHFLSALSTASGESAAMKSCFLLPSAMMGARELPRPEAMGIDNRIHTFKMTKGTRKSKAHHTTVGKV